MSDFDTASSMAGLAYNPTPAGFGMALGTQVLNGKAGGRPKFDGSFTNDNNNFVGGKDFANNNFDTSRYQITGDNGTYNLLAAGRDNPQGMPTMNMGNAYQNLTPTDNSSRIAGLLGNDPSALAQFNARFGQQGRMGGYNMTAPMRNMGSYLSNPAGSLVPANVSKYAGRSAAKNGIPFMVPK